MGDGVDKQGDMIWLQLEQVARPWDMVPVGLSHERRGL
jgi:hypothetical protein